MVSISKKLNKDIYSNEEIKTNKIWFGKPVYRKVIDCGNLPNATTKTIPVDIQNVDVVTDIRSMRRSNGDGGPIPNYVTSSYFESIEIQYSNNTITNLLIKTSANRVSNTAFAIIEYTKNE